ncbi:MAG: FKBP-type peptidyl-prolyl cis-trans isomerase [Myxococcota bacterium]|nr:FKBP-type peptidyl-prolyl cis-trans isomerase [Myxococcota bacterium]
MKSFNGTVLRGLGITLLIATASWAWPPAAHANQDAKTNKVRKDPFTAPADVAKAPADAIRTKSGLAYKVLKPGTGTVHPKPTSRVVVNYTGWQTDGRMFDSSYKRGKPAIFPVNRVIKGWTEGLQLMVAGEKARFWIPANLAYGEKPQGRRPGGELVFDIELIRIQ